MKWLIFLVFTLSGCFRESATLEQTNIDNKTVTQVDESTTKIKMFWMLAEFDFDPNSDQKVISNLNESFSPKLKK